MFDAETTEKLEAAAFRRLMLHLRQRQDATNIDLMGLAGFCRNCLSEWLEDAAHDQGLDLPRDQARAHVYGEPYEAFRARQPKATPEQLAAMDASLAENARVRAENPEGLPPA